MSEHGRAPTERAVSLAQCASIGYGPAPLSTVGRAHVASARAAPPPEGERAVARLRVHTREFCLLVGNRDWKVGARPCTEGEGRPAGAVGFHETWADSNQGGAARARRKRQFNSDPHTGTGFGPHTALRLAREVV